MTVLLPCLCLVCYSFDPISELPCRLQLTRPGSLPGHQWQLVCHREGLLAASLCWLVCNP